MDLTGKTAIILGGANGVGKASAEVFCRAGARVLIGDVDEDAGRETARQVAATGGQIEFAPCDVRDLDAVRALVVKAVEIFGVPDVGLYTTGVIKPANFLDLTPEDYDFVQDINLRGAVFFFQALAREMIAADKPGSLVSISSIGGVFATDRTHAYGASKAGLIHLAKSMAVSLSQYGIRANTVGPGGVNTAMQQKLSAEDRHDSLSRTPMLRLGEPEEIAEVALFLASDASSYVTGQTIYADGGRLALHRTVKVPDQPQ